VSIIPATEETEVKEEEIPQLALGKIHVPI
jgi:hypothetical protein